MTEPTPDPAPTSAPPRQSTLAGGSIAAAVVFVAALAVAVVFVGSGSDDPVSVAAGSDAVVAPSSASTAPVADATTAAPEDTQTGDAPTTGAESPPAAAPSTPPAPTATREAFIPPATPAPEPTPTTVPPTQPQSTPVPTVSPGTFDPQPLPVGPVHLPIAGGVEFVLQPARPGLHLPGHSAVYLDDAYSGEVNIFTPLADAQGRELPDFASVVDAVTRTPLSLAEIGPTTVDGYPAVVLDGTPDELQVMFYTAPGTASNPNAGWRTPGNVRMWVIDGPSGVVVVTAETLTANIAFQDAAIALAEDIVFTMTLFG